MITASAPAAQPADWRRSYRDAITDPHELLELLQLPQLRERLAVGDAGFALRVPRGYAARMRAGDPADPLLRQVLPLDLETLVVQGFGLDAVGDLDSRGAQGVLHKYDGRALLIATGSCAIHCRYCFRRHFPYAQELAAANAWRDAIEYLAATPQVDEVILSGGDPLSLSTGKLAELTDRMRGLPHIRRLRIHTRLPVVLPERIDPALLEWLESLPWPVVMVIHANHANEIDASVETVLGSLQRRGVRLLNQSVLLRGVNDDVDALCAFPSVCSTRRSSPTTCICWIEWQVRLISRLTRLWQGRWSPTSAPPARLLVPPWCAKSPAIEANGRFEPVPRETRLAFRV